MIPAPAARVPASRSLGAKSMLAGLLAGMVALSPMAPGTAQSQGRMSLIRDAEIEAILREDTDPILRAAGLEPRNVELHIVNDKDLNAFVAGGQHLFLNTGLIVKTKTPNELAGVIAHETGHIAGGHLARSGDGSRSAIATYAITMGLGILAALSGGESAAAGAAGLIYSADYFATMSLYSYTRVQESAADQAAASFLEKSGHSGAGLVSFFDNLRYQEVFSEARRFAYFRSHPLSSDRIEALRARVSTAEHYKTPDSEEDLEQHRIMVAKIKAFMNHPNQTYIDYPLTDISYPARYARAIADYKALETDKAIASIDVLITEQPKNPYLWELKGQALFESGRVAEAEQPYRKAVELAPASSLLRLSLGQVLLAQPKDVGVAEAITHLNRAIDYESENPAAWRFLSEAYERNNQPGLARLATAEQNFALGQLVTARTFALRARDLLEKDTIQFRRANDIISTSEENYQSRRRRTRA